MAAPQSETLPKSNAMKLVGRDSLEPGMCSPVFHLRSRVTPASGDFRAGFPRHDNTELSHYPSPCPQMFSAPSCNAAVATRSPDFTATATVEPAQATLGCILFARK